VKEPDKVRDIVVCDLDGTLALDEHRNHLLRGEGPRRWDEYFALCGGDAPNHPIIQLLSILNHARKRIYIFSGRSDQVRATTVEWLDRHQIVYERLEMRRADSRTDDHVLKLQWVEALGIKDRIWLVLEDRNRVVAAWRDAGYPCLQVRPGDF
jgi:hypothetical protein